MRRHEEVRNGIEPMHRFTRAVSVGSPQEFLPAEKDDQERAEAGKRLIKNGIICWNYLYLSQKLAQIEDPAKREEWLRAVAHGSAASWRHVNLLGEYGFSDDRLRNIDRLNGTSNGEPRNARNFFKMWQLRKIQ